MNGFPAELFKQMTLFPWQIQIRHLPLVTCNVSRLAASRWSTPHANDAREFGHLALGGAIAPKPRLPLPIGPIPQHAKQE
jgi:hypothetical protein